MIDFGTLHKDDTETLFFEWLNVLVQVFVGGQFFKTGDLLRPRSANGWVYECTSDGQSAEREPNWSVIDGGSTQVGSAVFATRKIGAVSEPTISTVIYSVNSTDVVLSNSAIDNDRLTSSIDIDATAAKPGRYIIEADMTDSAGKQHILRAAIEIVD